VKADKASYDAAVISQKSAKVAYHQAEDLAEQNYSAAVSSYDSAVSSRHSAKLNYDNAVTNADLRTVKAPISGYVTTLGIQNGDQLSNSGNVSSGSSSSSSSGSSAPIVISDLSTLQAQVQIAETDRPNVKLGQKVQLTFDAVPSLTLTGKVVEIDAVGTTSQSVVTYGVTIDLDVQNKKLKPGMTTSASIITKVDTNVVLVPNAAVKTDSSGNSYVQVLDSPTATPRDVSVVVGPAGDTNTEIKSGLTGTETVVTQTITAGSTGTAARSGLSVLGGAGRATVPAGGGGFGRGQ
jgi:membrane fusion protein, macrolide-specific efflux system